MALKSTIYKAQLQIADMDHHYYADHALTLARHPSETDERMMIRLAALALQAHQVKTLCAGDAMLSFGEGLSNPDEPDVWIKDYTQAYKVWIEVGQPEDKPIIKACNKAEFVYVYAFSHATNVWFKAIASKLTRPKNLRIYQIDSSAAKALQTMAQRNMQIQASIQDGMLTLSDVQQSVDIQPQLLL